MTHVCLGWGSLIWDPRQLSIAGEWQTDGPCLPLEFARVSSDGRVTLVLADRVPLVPVLWAPLAVKRLEDAVQALADREAVTRPTAIGRWPSSTRRPSDSLADIARWAEAKGFESVVWTALKAGFKDSRGAVPSLEVLLAHLKTLDAVSRAKAAEYISRAPAQIATPFRRPLLDALAAGR